MPLSIFLAYFVALKFDNESTRNYTKNFSEWLPSVLAIKCTFFLTFLLELQIMRHFPRHDYAHQANFDHCFHQIAERTLARKKVI